MLKGGLERARPFVFCIGAMWSDIMYKNRIQTSKKGAKRWKDLV